jgi:ribose transport system permease protein
MGLALAHPRFTSGFNIYVLLISFSLWSTIALAQMCTLAVGQLNLAVGAIGGLTAVVFGGLMQVQGVPVPLAALAGLALGVGAGLLNGVLTVRTGIDGFIITLATLSIFKGINLGITEAQPFSDIPAVVKTFGNASLGPVPYLLVVPVLVGIAIWVLVNRSLLGRHMLAVGGNSHAAQLSGISVGRVIVAAHALSGTLAAIGGMLAVARLQSAQPTIGDDWLIVSFAAPIIGGAVLTGGHVSVIGTLLGVVVIALINNGLVLMRIDPYWVQFLLGGLILAAVGVNRWREVQAERERVAHRAAVHTTRRSAAPA